MADEMTVVDTELVNILNGQHGLGDLIKPMFREIYLFDSCVAGTTHLKDKSVLDRIMPGDKLFLQREDNKYDSRAILILTEEKEKLGYVPERDNAVFSRLMDAGKLLSARITDVTRHGSYTHIKIRIFLLDF